jgi:predicted RNA-binding Zn-ribbon protein involved in translation (DUF1610 family)
MTRRITTAREQVEMLSPWRTAGEVEGYPRHYDKTVWTPEQEGMAAELGERLQQKGVSGLSGDSVTRALQELILMQREKEESSSSEDYDKNYNDWEAGYENGDYDEKTARRIVARALTADSTALMERPVEQKIPAPEPKVFPAQSNFQPKSTFHQPPLVGARGPNAAAKDPVNDPMGKLDSQHYGYEDMVNNIVSHFNGASEEQHRRGRFWYRDARNMFSEIAKKTGISLDRAVAIGAAFSPLTDWDINLEHAKDFIQRYNSNSPDFNENDWQIAHLHPQALQAFRDTAGRNPTDSDEDIEALADMHHGLFKSGPTLDGVNNLNDPKARDRWTSNIKHHGMEKILGDHERQVFQNKGKKDKDGNLVGYSPVSSMRDYGIPTLGGNITRAKMIARAEESPELFHALLKGPKVGNFSQNILDNSEMDDEGYFIHPNGDWTQHADLEGTIDAHHMRASTMADGQWERKGYHSSKNGLNPNNQFVYDVFNTGLQDATKRINSAIQDPRKHLTPKQVQAIVWIKHKEDNDRFRRVPIMHEDELVESEGLPLYQKVRGETLMKGKPVNPFSEKPKGMTKKKYEEINRIPRGVNNRLVLRSGSRDSAQREAWKMKRFWNKTAEYDNRVDRDRTPVKGECPGSGVRMVWRNFGNRPDSNPYPACAECGKPGLDMDHAFRAKSH